MSRLSVHHPCRLVCVAGLLLLAAAESRLYAGPLLEPVLPRPATDEESNKQDSQRRPIALMSTLPDPAPVRWTMSTDEIEESDPRLSAPTWVAQDDTQTAPLNPFLERPQAFALRPVALAPKPGAAQQRVADRLLTTICRTGPPQS